MPQKWGGGINYLALGNSITIHPIVDYWWSECGMASSTIQNDYYHIVVGKLNEEANVISHAYNFAVWETQSTDRAETLSLIDSFLDPALTLITVQLGENVSDMSTYESDYKYLLSYLHEKAPEAKVIVIGDFWNLDGRDEAKLRATISCDATYVDISSIKDNPQYMAGLGYKVMDGTGVSHIIEHNMMMQ